MAYRLPKLADSPFSQLMASLPQLLMRMKENQTAQANKDRQFLQNQKQQARQQFESDRAFDDANADQLRTEKIQADENKLKLWNESDTEAKWAMFTGGYTPEDMNRQQVGINLQKQMAEEKSDRELKTRRENAYIGYLGRYDDIDKLTPKQKWQLGRIDSQIQFLEEAQAVARLEKNQARVDQLEVQKQNLINQTDNIFGVETPIPIGGALIESPEIAEELGRIAESAGFSKEDAKDMTAPYYMELYNITDKTQLMKRFGEILKENLIKSPPQRVAKRPLVKTAFRELHEIFTGKRLPFIK